MNDLEMTQKELDAIVCFAHKFGLKKHMYKLICHYERFIRRMSIEQAMKKSCF